MTPQKTNQAARVVGKNGFSLISDETFRQLYAALVQCKMLDEQLQAQASYEPWPGREASTAGVAVCLRPGDSITPTPRSLLADYLHSGLLSSSFTAVRETAEQLIAASCDALRHKIESSGNIAVVFAGIGETNQGYKILTKARRQSLPIFFIVEDGAPLVEVCGSIPVIRVDGSDAVAVFRVAHESIARAREGIGPTIMECAAWPGDAEHPDPLEKLELYLDCKRLFQQGWKKRLENKYAQMLDDSLKVAGLSGA
jgi:TPP-dependent pyruvate/acetoin dehydrogenase alpha subunit